MNTAQLRYLICICAFLTPPALWAQSQLATSLSSQTNSARSPVADEIVAVVNTDVITRNELRIRVNSIERGLQAQGTPLPPVDVLNRQVLERMIDERAQLQQAKDDGIRVDDFTVDRTIAGIAGQNKMTPDQFRRRVEADGTSFSQFRDDVRNQIMIGRLRDHEVDSSVQVSEGEIDNFIAQQAGLPPENREIDIAEILIRVPEQATSEQIDQAKKKADDVYDQAAGGADFAKLAVTYSNAADYQTGGDMGWKTTDHYPQLFTDAVNNLTPGQTAKPVKSPVGFHILKLVGRRTAGAQKASVTLGIKPTEQTHARHILIRVNEVTTEAQAKARLSEIRQRIISGKATFEDMARAYSADGSAAKGGDLGNVFPGDTVPDFERAMNALPPGGISEPVTTQFGVHLIQVLGRSTEEVPEARVRLLAKQAVHERKVEEAYEDWVRSVRDEAYVEVRLLDDRS